MKCKEIVKIRFLDHVRFFDNHPALIAKLQPIEFTIYGILERSEENHIVVKSIFRSGDEKPSPPGGPQDSGWVILKATIIEQERLKPVE